MNGFYLAAGFGTRMREYTKNCPKPLLSIQGIRLLDYSLYLGKKWGIHKAIVNTHYLGWQISDHLNRFQEYPVHISHEDSILGTAGGIAEGLRRYSTFLHDDLLLMNPDTIFLPEDDGFLPHCENSSDCHLYLLPIPQGKSYTKISLDHNGYVRFDSDSQGITYYYIGMSILKKEFLAYLSTQCNGYAELGQIWKDLSKNNRITGSVFPGKAIDVGEKELLDTLNEPSNPIWTKINRYSIQSMFQSMPI